MRRARIGLLGLGLSLVWGLTAPALAQSDQFAPAVTVNGTVVTRYELSQRRVFLKTLNQPGDVAQQALNGLITDRLQTDAAKAVGITVSDAEVKAGMDDFASRGNLSTEDFIRAIAENGVQPQTFRDFIKAGVLWRSLLRAKFVGTIRISEAEIDRAIAAGADSGGTPRVLLSEIVLTNEGGSDTALIAQRIHDKVKSEADFALQAKLFSKVGTAPNGGALGWMDVSALPPEVASALSTLKAGEMTRTISQKGALTIYFLRDVSQGAGPAKGPPMVDYAVFQPGAGSDVAKLKARLTSCDELYMAARGSPQQALQRQTVAEAALPPALRGAVAGLDAGESAILTASNGAAQLVMLCSRIPQSKVPPSRDDIRSGLVSQKINLLAEAYLEELRSNAIIVQQ
ncbi:MAG: peptidylprolyl isomerase [Cypionkella sp.]